MGKVIAPAAITVTTNDPEGISVDVAIILTFLNSATATDSYDGNVAVTHNAPATFGIGESGITFGATDSAGKYGFGESSVTVTLVDTVAPQILEAPIIVNITHQSVAIRWQANEAADAVIEYGLNPDELNLESFNTRHNMTIVGLLEDTSYHLTVRNTDAAGNTVVYPQTLSFKTEVKKATVIKRIQTKTVCRILLNSNTPLILKMRQMLPQTKTVTG